MMEEIRKTENNFFDQKSDFKSSINPITLGFIDNYFEEEFFKSKYERKNVLKLIGGNIFFNMFLIGIRQIFEFFRQQDILKNSPLSIMYYLLPMILCNVGIIIEAIIFFIPKIKLLRGFALTLIPLLGIASPKMYLALTTDGNSSINFPPTVIFYLMISIVAVILYSSNWICGSIQVILMCIILSLTYFSTNGDLINDIIPNIFMTCTAAFIVILTIYYVEYFQRKSTYMRLEAERQRNNLKQILDKIPDPILISGTSKIVYTNNSYEKLHNKEESEMSSSVLSDKDLENINKQGTINTNIMIKDKNSLLSKMINEKSGETLEELIENKSLINKSRFELNLNLGVKNMYEINSIIIDGDKEKYMLYFMTNLTYIEKVKEMKDKEKYVRTYFASLTHDFRTPISIVSGNTEILLDLLTDEIPRKHLNNIANASKFLSLLVQDILDYSQIKAGSLELSPFEFNIEKEFNILLNLFIDKYKSKNLSLKMNIDENVPSIMKTDGNKISQILMNLLSNAFKFTQVGGVKINVSFSDIGELTIVEVKDSGIGMTEEETKTLFMEFCKIKSHKLLNPNGIGLGLHICQNLATKLGGEIVVNSKVGIGTTFQFSFKPFSQEIIPSNVKEISEKAKQEDEPWTYIPSNRGKLHNISTPKYSFSASRNIPLASLIKDEQNKCDCSKILLVDDDIGIREILHHYSKGLNIKCDEADNGKMAFEKVKSKLNSSCCVAYDIIFTDYYMPEMDGIQSAIEIKDLLQRNSITHTNIILVSGLSNDERKYINSLPLMPFTLIETKPLSKAKFKEIIKKYIFHGRLEK